MRIETYGHEIEVTPALREYVETKLKRLERHFDQPFEVRTQLGTRKPDYLAEATINVAGRTLHADAGAQTMYAAIDILADKLDRLLVKHKEKRTDVQRAGARSELIGLPPRRVMPRQAAPHCGAALTSCPDAARDQAPRGRAVANGPLHWHTPPSGPASPFPPAASA